MNAALQPKRKQGHGSRDAQPAHNVAIVDDDASVRRALGRFLSLCSFRVRTYASAAEFLDSLKSDAPDCLVLDLQMPGMTGLDLVHHLAGAGFSFPILVATAQDEVGVRSRCQLAGAAAFLLKPFQTELLLQALMAALGVADASQPDEN